MKKIKLSRVLVVFVLIITLTACAEKGGNVKNYINSDEKVADMTFDKIISAINVKDDSAIADMFSYYIQNENDIEQSALRFIEFIDGDIISSSSASEAGVGTDYEKEKGKFKKEIKSSFCVNTTENVYYIAIKECIEDEFDSNNIGIHSIYIIESKDWTEDYIYRGDGKWTHGINIVNKAISNTG